MTDLCSLCRPWPDGGCDFGCPCRECDEGRKYEAFVTNPYRNAPSAEECSAFLAWLRGGEVGSFQFSEESDDGYDLETEIDEYVELGLSRADFY